MININTSFYIKLMRGKVLALFDVDGTLTKPRNNIEPDMI